MSGELNCVLDRFEGKMAVVKTVEGAEILWPIKILPENLEIGDKLNLNLTKAEAGSASNEEMAKAILNEVLNTDENQSGKN